MQPCLFALGPTSASSGNWSNAANLSDITAWIVRVGGTADRVYQLDDANRKK